MKVKLTKSIVERPSSIKGFDGAQTRIYWDQAQPGFGLRVYAERDGVPGARSYVYAYTLAGKSPLITIGSASEWTLDDAREAAQARRKLASEGKDPERAIADSARAAVAEQTMGEILTPWFDWYQLHGVENKPPAIRTLYNMRSIVKALREWCGSKYPLEMTNLMLVNLRDDRADTESMFNAMLSTLDMVWRWARKRGLIPAGAVSHGDLFDDIEPFGRNDRDRLLEQDELARLKKVLNAKWSEGDDNQRRQVLAIRLGAATGRRLANELLTLRWTCDRSDKCNYVDATEKKLKIEPHKTMRRSKGKVLETDFSKSDEIQDLLAQIEKLKIVGNPYLFPSLASPEARTHMRRINVFWRSVCKEAGVFDARPHDLRGVFITSLLDSGEVTLEETQRLIGHANPTMTEKYRKRSPKAREREREIMHAASRVVQAL